MKKKKENIILLNLNIIIPKLYFIFQIIYFFFEAVNVYHYIDYLFRNEHYAMGYIGHIIISLWFSKYILIILKCENLKFSHYIKFLIFDSFFITIKIFIRWCLKLSHKQDFLNYDDDVGILNNSVHKYIWVYMCVYIYLFILDYGLIVLNISKIKEKQNYKLLLGKVY
jgi:hypothetical protein